jgi:hypothetical protein
MSVFEQLQRLSDARFLSIYESLAQNGFGPLDGEVAKLLKYRPQAIRNVPMAQRATRARGLLTAKHNSEMCYELFGGYLIARHRELVTGFLEATGVKHQDGMLEDLDHNKPDAAKLDAAVAELDTKFDPEDVTLYLALCAEQWPQTPELAALWRKRAG